MIGFLLLQVKESTHSDRVSGNADQILAGVFLEKFVAPDCAWVHLDLAARRHAGGLAHIPTEMSRFGVRYTLNLLSEQRLLQRLS